MSELTQCNYCRLQEMKKVGFRVYVMRGKDGGYDIYRVPKGKKLDEKYRIAWMLEIPDHCVR